MVAITPMNRPPNAEHAEPQLVMPPFVPAGTWCISRDVGLQRTFRSVVTDTGWMRASMPSSEASVSPDNVS